MKKSYLSAALAALSLAAQAATPEAKAPAPVLTFAEAKKAISTRVTELDKAKKPFFECIAAFEELRETPPYATNLVLRAEVNRCILNWCLLPGWTSLKRYDRDACSAKGVELCRAVLASADYSPQDKERYASTLAALIAGEKDFAEAEKVAREQIARVEALEKPNPVALSHAWLILADVYRWQDRPAQMVAAIEKARAAPKGEGTRLGSDKARALGGLNDLVDEWWRDFDDTYAEAVYFADKDGSRCRKAALDYVLNPSNAVPRRFDLAQEYFFGDDQADSRQARAALGKENLARCGGWRFPRSISTAFQQGDFNLVAHIYDDLCPTSMPKNIANPRMHRVHLIALAAVGRTDEAIALAKAHEADADNTSLDILRYQVYAAILSGRDALPVIAASSCERKDKMAATLSAARQCQLWERGADAEKYADAYLAYFGPPPKRVAKVVWSDTPVTYVSDWRAIAKKLESHPCDLPFTGNLDFLETDVATGREKVEAAEGEKPGRMAFTTVADRYALHIFLRVEDAEARLVESGFKGGVTTEMYFAPGADQPYTCFGSNPRDGLTFTFQTSYPSADHARLDREATKGTHFKSEAAFSDNDYVLHLTFPWDDFYQKLPSPKAEWKFECMAWGVDGGFTWGGSIGIHNASRWGTLAIDLTPAQLTEIRRGILMRTAKGGWRNRPYPGGASLDYFDKWADPEIGDPAFYEASLKPLKEELADYAARIKPDMTDADVNELYEKGLVRMKGLKYEIDRLRREYLARQLTE